MTMNPAIKQAWVEALRSGDYRQGTGSLESHSHGEVNYCCLGVLARICAVPADRVPITDDPQVFRMNFDFGRGQGAWSGMPTDEWCQSLGLPPQDAARLASLNDDGESFEHIALVIEKTL